MAEPQTLLKSKFPRCHELADGKIIFEPVEGVLITWSGVDDDGRRSVKIRDEVKGREIDANF